MAQSPATPKNQPSPPPPPPPPGEAKGRLGYRLPRSALIVFREAGVDVDALLLRVGLDADALAGRVEVHKAEELLTLAFAAVGDPAFGLTVGAKVRPELFGVVGFAAMSAATYGAALSRLARYKRMMSGDQIEIQRDAWLTRVRVLIGDRDSPYAAQKVDMELAFLLTFGRLLTGRPIPAERVTLEAPRPSYHARYDALFGCPVDFDAPSNEITFRSVELDLPMVSANPELAALFEQKAEELLPEGAEEPELAERVRGVLRRAMRGELPDIAVVARELATSERSLQRKLQQEGKSFQQLVSEVRLELARRHLKDVRVDAVEVSYLLGFSHPNSFYRAFKRWTGMTPEEYRRSAAPGGVVAG